MTVNYGEHSDREQPVTTWSQAGDSWGCLGVSDDYVKEEKEDSCGLEKLVVAMLVVGGLFLSCYVGNKMHKEDCYNGTNYSNISGGYE